MKHINLLSTTACLIVLGMSARPAQADVVTGAYRLAYNPGDGSLTIQGVNDGLIQYQILSSTGAFTTSAAPLDHLNHQPVINLWSPPGQTPVSQGVQESTPNTILAANLLANTNIQPSGDLLLGNLLATGLNEQQFLNAISHAQYITKLGTSKQDFDLYYITATPEPTSLALLGLGGLLIARRRRAS